MKPHIVHGYSEVILKKLPNNCIDIVFTSPPYADRRKSVYGGISEKNYVSWFKPIAIEIKRVLKPTGSFFLNIKPHTDKGERSLYVFDLILLLKRNIGFRYVEEYCWTKNAFPGKLIGRFKNGFELVYHFTKGNPNEITFNPLACGTPVKEVTIKRAYGKQSGLPYNGSNMTGINLSNLKKLKIARPSNVINVNNVINQHALKKVHPATFPEKLVEFFVKSFSNENDLVVDPFAGSGTVGVVCKNIKRKSLLIDKEKKYVELMKRILT